MTRRRFDDLSLLELFLWPWKHAFAQDLAALERWLAEPGPRPGEGTIAELVLEDPDEA